MENFNFERPGSEDVDIPPFWNVRLCGLKEPAQRRKAENEIIAKALLYSCTNALIATMEFSGVVKIANASKIMEPGSNATIFRQGDEANEMHFVYQGRVKVPRGVLSAGDVRV